MCSHPPLDIGMLRDKWSTRRPDFFTVFRRLLIELDRKDRDNAAVCYLMSWAKSRREHINWSIVVSQYQRIVNALEQTSYSNKEFLRYTKWLLDDPIYGVRTNIKKDSNLVEYLSSEYINKLHTIFGIVYDLNTSPVDDIRLAYINDMYEKLGFQDPNNPNEMYTDTSEYNFCMTLMAVVNGNYRSALYHHRVALHFHYGLGNNTWYNDNTENSHKIMTTQLRAFISTVLD